MMILGTIPTPTSHLYYKVVEVSFLISHSSGKREGAISALYYDSDKPQVELIGDNK